MSQITELNSSDIYALSTATIKSYIRKLKSKIDTEDLDESNLDHYNGLIEALEDELQLRD